MLQNKIKVLDENEQVLLFDAAANPAIKKLLFLEKEDLQNQLLSTFQQDDESDSRYLRKLEAMRKQINFIDELIDIFEIVIKNHST